MGTLELVCHRICQAFAFSWDSRLAYGKRARGIVNYEKRGRNGLKRIVLAVMADCGWLSAPMIRHLAGYDQIRPLNRCLERYHRWGLLKRMGSWNSKPVLYRITKKGLAKLEWLRKVMP